MTLEAVLNGFLASRGEKHTSKGKALSKSTLAFYQEKASMVAAVLGAATLASRLSAATIDDYISARRKMPAKRDKNGKALTDKLVSDHTISKELAVLRAALQLAKRRGAWGGDLDAIFPSSGDFSAGYDPKKGAERALSRDDVAKLLATMKPHKFAVMAFAIATSAEMAALRQARWFDIAEDRSTVHVRGTKNERRDRRVPITTLEQAMLLDFALRHAPGQGALMFPSLSNILRDFNEAAKAAGIHHFSPHSLRHTLAKWLTAGGVHAAVVGSMLGHADGRMVERTYGHLRHADEIRSAVEAQYRPPALPSPEKSERILSGKAGEDGTHGSGGMPLRYHEVAIFQEDAVGPPGLEPGTYGLKVRPEMAAFPVESGRSGESLRGFCTASDPDDAVKVAIKVAVDAGRFELATKLIEALKSVAPMGKVVRMTGPRKIKGADDQ